MIGWILTDKVESSVIVWVWTDKVKGWVGWLKVSDCCSVKDMHEEGNNTLCTIMCHIICTSVEKISF